MSPLSVDLSIRVGMAALSSTVAIGVVWLLCRFLTRLSPTVRHWLWWLACLKLLLGLAALPTVPLAFLPAVAPSAAPLAPVKLAASAKPTTLAQGPTVVELPQLAADKPAVQPVGVGLPLILFGVWLVGIGVGIGGQVMALWQLRRLASGGEVCESPVLWEAVRRADLPHLPTLRVVPSPVEPLTMAAPGRPLILIARDDRERLSDEELLPILTHECLHIKRGDLFLSLVPWLAQTLFWFLPPVYLAMREFELAREAACDRQTVAALALSPQVYGELIVKLSSPASPIVTPASAMALSAGFRLMKRRIEMLSFSPKMRPTRAMLALTTIAVTAVLIPWRLTPTVAATPPAVVPAQGEEVGGGVKEAGELLPNLDFSQGIKHWEGDASNSAFTVGSDSQVRHNGAPSAFVRSKSATVPTYPPGQLSYTIPPAALRRYQGKRLRFRAYVKAVKTTGTASLEINPNAGLLIHYGSSEKIAPTEHGDWQSITCVTDIMPDTEAMNIGLRLDGAGTVYMSGVTLEVVDASVPTTPVQIVDGAAMVQGLEGGPANLTFAQGLAHWWTKNPGHLAATDSSVELLAHGGRNGGPAVLLKSLAANSEDQGTFAQMATPASYLGKRVRFSAYLKTDDAGEATLWCMAPDGKESGDPSQPTEAGIDSGTKEWTKVEYTLDIPQTAKGLMLGVTTSGKGKVWVDGFQIEVVGPSQK